MTENRLRQRLDELAEEFADLDPRERLEMLLDFAEEIRELPPEYRARMEAGEAKVNECMTPVHLWVVVEDGKLRLLAHVAEEAPTVKGFVGMLVGTVSGATPREVGEMPQDLIAHLGLRQALGMTRLRGLGAVVQRVRAAAERET